MATTTQPTEPTTLRQLLDTHPEWADLHIVVYRDDGTLHYLGAQGSAYEHQDDNEPDCPKVLVFAPN